MPTVVIASKETKNHYISVELQNRYGNNFYIVQVCPKQKDNLCGYPIREVIYRSEKKAKAAFNRYIRTFKEV